MKMILNTENTHDTQWFSSKLLYQHKEFQINKKVFNFTQRGCSTNKHLLEPNLKGVQYKKIQNMQIKYNSCFWQIDSHEILCTATSHEQPLPSIITM